MQIGRIYDYISINLILWFDIAIIWLGHTHTEMKRKFHEYNVTIFKFNNTYLQAYPLSNLTKHFISPKSILVNSAHCTMHYGQNNDLSSVTSQSILNQLQETFFIPVRNFLKNNQLQSNLYFFKLELLTIQKEFYIGLLPRPFLFIVRFTFGKGTLT